MAKRLVISGRVQGVGYRESMRYEAERLGIVGWVRNRREGSVEAVIDGPDDALARLVDWCRRGPPAARVTAVEVSEADGTYSRFERWPTA